MAKSREAYVDTSAWIAFVDRGDAFHPLFRRLFARPPALLTTGLVLAEGHAWLLRRHGRAHALDFLALIEKLTVLEVVEIGTPALAGATQVLRRFSDQDLTLVDAVGLWLMAERRPKSCWSTDFHLGVTGVPLVIHELG